VFLSDSELLDRVEGAGPIVTGLTVGEGAERYDSDAPVQPCSIDLSVGNIYVPGAESGELGSEGMPRDGLVLDPGKTAVIETQEQCHLPDKIGAIGFPPNSVSSKGILMTNPGHVDPGYDGSMSFTVINMGQEPFTLLRGRKIVTLLFFELGKASERDLSKREHPRDGIEAQLAVLSHDFLDITARVKKAVTSEERKTQRLAIIAPIVIGLLTLIGAALVFHGEIRDLKAQADALGDVQRLERRVQTLEHEHAGRGGGADAGQGATR
jgi:deoxycytidine triphosphate deaminase